MRYHIGYFIVATLAMAGCAGTVDGRVDNQHKGALMANATDYSLRPGHDHGILWNVPCDADGNPSLRYFQSRPGISAVFSSEASEVKEAVAAVITATLVLDGVDLTDYRGRSLWDGIRSLAYRGEVDGSFQPLDRTLETPLSNSRLFTLNVVQKIQRTLRDSAPDWRVQVCGTEALHEPSLMIYSDAIVVGSIQPDEASLPDTLERWRQQIGSLRDSTIGVDERRYQFFLNRIPTLQERLRQERVVVAAAFPSTEHGLEHTDAYVVFYGSYILYSVDDSDQRLEYSTYITSLDPSDVGSPDVNATVCVWQVRHPLPVDINVEYATVNAITTRNVRIDRSLIVPGDEYRRRGGTD